MGLSCPSPSSSSRPSSPRRSSPRRPPRPRPPGRPPTRRPIHPGVQTITDGAQCTSNFVFSDASDAVYIGQAAHCSGTGGSTETNGCDSGSLPIGTPVEVDGAGKPGTLVYNSWLTMQANGETDPDTCAYNDLALVKLDPADYGKVNPSIPFWGGPTGITGTLAAGDKVLSYGNSSLRLRHHAAEPEGGREPRRGGQRLEPQRPHRHAPASPVTPAARSSTAPARRSAC